MTTALRERFSDGHLDHALAQLPRSLRTLLYYGEDGAANPTEIDGHHPGATTTGDGPPLERLMRLEALMARLAGVVQVLVDSVEQQTFDEPIRTRALPSAHEAVASCWPAT